ncbi:TPA: oligosaccharide flippase family protein, partial [Streptococcus suis]|nr:oligosaccharide flippase family protein [Streptococcus suis]
MAIESGNVKKAGIGYIIGNYFLRGIGFLTLPLFSRLLTTEDFGEYNTFLSYGNILFVFVGLALHTSYKSAQIKYENGFENYVSNTLVLCIISSVLFLFGGVSFSFLFKGVSFELVFWLILYSFGTAITAYYNSYLSIYFKSASYIKLATMSAIGNILVSLVLIFSIFSDNRSMGRIIGTTLPVFVVALIWIINFFNKWKPNLNKSQIKFALRYSVPLIPHGISQVLLSSCDRVMIAWMVGNSQAGIYSFAYTIYSLISVTFSSLDQVWSPWFFQQMKVKNTSKISEVADQYAFGIAIFTIIAMLAGPELIFIIGSDDFLDSKYLFVPVVVGGFFSFMYSFPAAIEYYYGKTKYIAIGTSFAAVINILLNFVGIKIFGYSIAAYTTLLTYLLYFIFHYYISINLFNGKSLYNIRNFVAICTFVCIGGVTTQLLINQLVIRW